MGPKCGFVSKEESVHGERVSGGGRGQKRQSHIYIYIYIYILKRKYKTVSLKPAAGGRNTRRGCQIDLLPEFATSPPVLVVPTSGSNKRTD
jgi:hypothetical protein